MAETTSAKIYGLKEMEDALKAMSSQLTGNEKSPVPVALNAARRSVLARAKAAAEAIKSDEPGTPVDWYQNRNGKWQAANKKFADPGRLARAIITMDERHPKVYSVVKYVGVRRGKNRNDERGAWYAPIVEFKGGRGGRGQGFMTRSINAQADGRIYAKSLATNVEKLAKKIGDENIRKVAAQVRKAHTLKKGGSNSMAFLNWKPSE